MGAVRFLMPIVLILGTALQASAQQARTTFEGFGCRLDLSQLPEGSVPSNLEDTVLVAVDTFKNCPGSSPNPAIQLECDMLIPEWATGFVINASERDGLTCEISGAQCGINRVLTASNVRLTIDPVVIDNEVFGDAHLRCSRSTTSN
ncbi:MAG: hypothetical protein K0S35_76 [Geminicoccaceae bacterium]|jgi:hypothetical protein|nr:hypothetical protein [Geminicoccaceae bacterium]